jgi:hypothetical protein
MLGNKIFYEPNYLFDKQTIQQKKTKLFSVADGILKQLIHHTMDDYAKELALHDYLIKQVVYDYDSLSMRNPPNEIYSAYGALINNKAVCSGYAHAMKLLLDRCGIDCLIVTGDSTIPDSNSSVGHAWNIVKIKQQFYHLDVTWDAPINKRPNELFHYYFNVTDKDILIDHTWIFDTPKCTADEYNYFTVQGLNINDEAVLIEKLKQAIRDKKSTFIFRYIAHYSSAINSDKLNAMISNIWENGSLSRLFISGSLSWTVSYNDRQKVFNVAFSYG